MQSAASARIVDLPAVTVRPSAAQRAELAGQATAIRTVDLPTITVERARLAAGIPFYELLREAGLAASNGEARRLIKGGGARANDAAIAEETQAATLADLADGVIKLSAGKKRHALVKLG